MIPELEEQCWALDIHFARYILPRLLYLKNWVDNYSYPSELEDSYAWNELLEELVWTFSYIERGYPSVSSHYIADVQFNSLPSSLPSSFVFKTIDLIYTDEELYKKAFLQDKLNLSRCKRGLSLFSKFYLNLWN